MCEGTNIDLFHVAPRDIEERASFGFELSRINGAIHHGLMPLQIFKQPFESVIMQN